MRELGHISDVQMQRVDEVARGMGRACGVDEWVYNLFAEEVSGYEHHNRFHACPQLIHWKLWVALCSFRR